MEQAEKQPEKPYCNVIMKGGITSGVVYPLAVAEFADTYRLRGLGGASAGAIGAALGAAAEFGRDSGGFEVLRGVPNELRDGKLGKLFQPDPATRGLFRLLLAATGHDRPGASRSGPGRIGMVLTALVTGFPIAAVLGLLPGVALIVLAVLRGDWIGLIPAVIVLVVGFAVAMAIRLYGLLTRTLPKNFFGICRGLSVGADDGFTDWLADQIDAIAVLPRRTKPLTFGDLRTNPGHEIDLRMVTTCLTQGTPYGLPFDTYEFFYNPEEWARVFPAYVMKALDEAHPAHPDSEPGAELSADEKAAAAHNPPLRRLPEPDDLPVIVATRLSLSFPLLISAVPIWIVKHRQGETTFQQHWFTDGGFCSNFPVHMFDSALPEWPTFAINLSTEKKEWQPAPDQRQNLAYATSNQSGLTRPYRQIPGAGLGAVLGFASGALDTSRNWSDSSYLRYPGFRDRTVLVKQSKSEGGLNLFMDEDTIHGLAERGRVAAEVMVERYTTPQFRKINQDQPSLTGWDNHRWVRYRALVSALPDFLASFAAGREALGLDPAEQRSYHLSAPDIAQAEAMLAKLDEAATIAEDLKTTHPRTYDRLTQAPNPRARLRGAPQI